MGPRVEVERARRPFWMHQLVEYLIGVVLISVSFQSPEPALPAVMGVLVLVNSAIAIGPAGAFRLIHRKVHRVLDVVLMLALVVAAFQPWIDADVTGRLILGAIAFVMFFVWFHSDFEDRAGRKARRSARAAASSEERGRQAGRLVGDAVNTARRWRNDR